MPTFIELSGGKYPETIRGLETEPYAGVSFLPSVTDDCFDDSRLLFWEHEGNRAVRHGNWKLVSEYPGSWSSLRTYPEGGRWELYNLENDCTETVNLASRHPELAEEMSALWYGWAADCGVVDWALLGE